MTQESTEIHRFDQFLFSSRSLSQPRKHTNQRIVSNSPQSTSRISFVTNNPILKQFRRISKQSAQNGRRCFVEDRASSRRHIHLHQAR